METRVFQVSGMTCRGCAKSVEGILKRQKGVSEAKVDLEAANVKVDFDPAQIQPEELKKAVQLLGYDLLLN